MNLAEVHLALKQIDSCKYYANQLPVKSAPLWVKDKYYLVKCKLLLNEKSYEEAYRLVAKIENIRDSLGYGKSLDYLLVKMKTNLT